MTHSCKHTTGNIVLTRICIQAFADISDSLRADRFLYPHFRYYIREVRVVAYTQVSCWVHRCIADVDGIAGAWVLDTVPVQFLESYKSVRLQSMASAFGISEDFLDQELADFIVAGRLTAKIDKVAGVIETNR